jgi:hypothetical protein
MFGERWTKGIKIEEKHFVVDGHNMFIFPNDLDFIGETSNCDYFVDCFNEMISERYRMGLLVN